MKVAFLLNILLFSFKYNVKISKHQPKLANFDIADPRAEVAKEAVQLDDMMKPTHTKNGSGSKNRMNQRKQKPNPTSKRFKRDNNMLQKKEEEYEVEKIVAHKITGGEHMYLVKWENWSVQYNSWEPLDHLSGCLSILFDFYKNAMKNYCEQEFKKFKRKLTVFKNEELVELLKEFHTGNSIVIPEPDLTEAEKRLKIMFCTPVSERDPGLLQLVRRDYMINTIYLEREVQLQSLLDWENEMNTISMDSAPIRVVNLVDFEQPPANFIYINDYLPGKDVNIPDDPPFGCSCISCTPHKQVCCGRSSGVVFAYDKESRVKLPVGSPIYECNKRCKCSKDCKNRVVQKGRKIKLCIFRTNNGCGWGVKTLEDIPKGSFVTEYVGEVIKFEEAEKRGANYDRQEKTYLFDLDFNDSNHFPYTVDAAVYGNISHFINHSCDPNMRVYAVWINCLDPNLPKLCFFACKDIKRHEELSFDYLCQSPTKNRQKNKKVTNEDEKKNSFKMLCKCGSKNCRKYYF